MIRCSLYETYTLEPGPSPLQWFSEGFARAAVSTGVRWVGAVCSISGWQLLSWSTFNRTNLQRQLVCWREVDCQRFCVPGDRGETDLAEEERPMLKQLGVKPAGSEIFYLWDPGPLVMPTCKPCRLWSGWFSSGHKTGRDPGRPDGRRHGNVDGCQSLVAKHWLPRD